MKTTNPLKYIGTRTRWLRYCTYLCLALLVVITLSARWSRGADAGAQLGSPSFSNPSEIRSRAQEKTLRGVLRITSGKYQIPGVGDETVRQFDGWDPAQPPPAPRTAIGPGPTLRARLGDQVKLAFLNQADDSKFAYSNVTERRPDQPNFGCDQGANGYPTNDTFPNCFHGSNIANVHFHGTHTSPDGVGDNVLVQVLPQVTQPNWTPDFTAIFAGKIPIRWQDLPQHYQDTQLKLIQDHDTQAVADAKKNGLQPPTSLYDADMAAIRSGQWPQYLMGAFPNYFEIPDYASGKYKAGQAPGTHWYHAHKHGSTSIHMFNGLAGAFIIESNAPGGYDHFIRNFYSWGDSYGDHEKILVFQQFDVSQNLQRPNNGAGPRPMFVNGQMTPTITMRPGEVQFWRLVMATSGNDKGILNPQTAGWTTLFNANGFKFQQTAKDGVQFAPENYTLQPFVKNLVPDGFMLAGGNRADLLVQAPMTPGIYAFQNNPPGPPVPPNLFFVEVKGTPVNLPQAFPTNWPALPDFLKDLPVPDPKANPSPNVLRFQWEEGRTGTGPNPNGSGGGPHFMINDKQFEQKGPMIDQCMPLNAVQDWVLENYTTIRHPFHIHINPFQVLKIEAATGPGQYTTYTPPKNTPPVWQDVIAIPPAVFTTINGKTIITPGRVTIRQAFVDFTGTYVLHCHILAHEDRGMMQLVRVTPANQFPQACQNSIPKHH